MLMEAVAMKAQHEDNEAQKEAEKEREREQWKGDKSDLEQFR